MSPKSPAPCISRKQFLKTTSLALGTLALAPRPTSAQTPSTLPTSAPATHAPYDLREFLSWALDIFEPTIKLSGAGHYSRNPGGPPELYGTADMACVLYTLNKLRPSDAERAEWLAAFLAFQKPDTGWLIENAPTHAALHNLAFSLSAMELLNLTPKNPVIIGPDYADPKAFLATLNWKTAVYTESHKGAGIGSVHALLPALNKKEWFDGYFEFCDAMVDPNNGMLGQGKPPGGDFDQIGGTFHYFFLYNYFNRHMPFPEKRIDAILALQLPSGHWDTSNKTWLTLDAIYLLTRTLRYAPHRTNDVHACLHKTMAALMADMYSPAIRKTAFGGRLPAHTLTCAVSILAELQQFWGAQQILSNTPLKLILDRRPFI